MTATTRNLPTGTRLGSLMSVLRRQNDLLLAALLVAIVALFVLPLPTQMLDLLVAANLSMSMVLLIVAMYVPSALSLSTFPSLLLFTTLFRLALNIASTKLILLHANAGSIIETFGRLIVGNNVVVGAVVFMIIAIVQFIVIAKGSERVAEVAARFALDAMPGKQMSIDADVRAGVLSAADAQQRRQLLEQECQLHGAMDGAMKFVKGDAIAGIVIAIVNILAGIAIGTMMLDMAVGDALQRYAVLTIGDGMVSQIPSLLVSIAAGVVITRVGGEGGADAQLAAQIGRQIVAHPRALVVAGLAMCSFLVVPGFPKWAFGSLAVGIVVVGLVVRKRRLRQRTPAWISHRDDAPAAQADDAVAAPLAVRLSPALRGWLDRHELDRCMSRIRTELERDLGPVFPRLHVGHAAGAPAMGYQILVQDVPVAQAVLQPGRVMIDPATPATPPPGADVAEPFGPFHRVVWVDHPSADLLVLPCEEVIARHAQHTVKRHVQQLIGLQEVHRLLHSVQRDAPDLAAEVSRVVPVQRMAEVLRRLLQEGIPVRNLHQICESLVNWAPREQDNIALTELVRVDMGRYITSRHVGVDRRINAILFESTLLERVNAAIERSARGNLLLLSPAVTQEIRDQVRRILDTTDLRVVAIASTDVRRYMKTMLEPVAPDLPVLSYQEVDDDVALQPVGWITNPKAA